MPQFDDSSDDKLPTVSLLIKTAFRNYEIAITKYEKLLVDNTTLNALINEKLSKFPDNEGIKDILEKFADDAADSVSDHQHKLDETERVNAKETQELISKLNKTVDKMLTQFKIIMAWLVILSAVGTASLTYFKIVLDSKKSCAVTTSRSAENSSPIPRQLYVECVDGNGKKITVPFPPVVSK